MKNIENKDIQEAIAMELLGWGSGEDSEFLSNNEKFMKIYKEANQECDDIDIAQNTTKYMNQMIDWLNDEYVEPHHWEDWELQIMCHLHLSIKKMWRSPNGHIQYRVGIGTFETIYAFDLPSIKNKEVIDIDKELKAHGMSR